MTLIVRRLAVWAALLGLLLAAVSTAPARAAGSPSLRISEQAGGVLIVWDGPAAPLSGWPTLRFGAVDLPARLLTLRADGPLTVRLEQLASAPWRGALAPATPERPVLPARLIPPAEPERQDLPAAPVTLLRQGRLRGVGIAVVAVTPVFAQAAGMRAVQRLRAFVPGATLLRAPAADLLASDAPFLAGAPEPSLPAQGGPAWRVGVAQGGIQRLSAAALAAAGVEGDAADRLHLRRGGRELPLEKRAGPDGLDELRFYAPAPGDRWNTTDTYWLTLEQSPGVRMAVRDVAPGEGTPERDTALERGVWRRPAVYDSVRPGPSGDHWFAAWLRPGDAAPLTATLALSPGLPGVGGELRLRIDGEALTTGGHTLVAASAGAVAATSWSGPGLWRRELALPSVSDTLLIRAASGGMADIIAPDRIAWERPVRLLFDGRGARFSGVPGRWIYRLDGPPNGAVLYDISDPAAPALLAGAGGRFEDGGESQTPRDYLLAGPGTVAEPTLAAWQPPDYSTPADTLYIAPAALHAALAPLAEWRRAQGRSVRVIDVQALYDGWSGGEVDPEAIRSFLRYAAARWRPAPHAVVLVGDGSADPHNYGGHSNVSLIPPYLAMVDPWLGETACESCYAQLDGDDPADDGADLLPDVRLGRLPVKDAAEAQRLVAKILAYEAAGPGGLWRSRGVFVADNGREADGTPDPAGDFPALADAAVAQQPRGLETARIYYDPWGRSDDGRPLDQPWRLGDGAQAHGAVLAALNGGAGLVSYTGHANPWQWGVTALDSAPGYLLGLYEPDNLVNGGRLPIVLAMTCLTSAFQTPAYGGMVIDERLLLAREGGAVAVWGATGLGIPTGHALLQRGFYRALWASPPQQAALGDLAAAGELELFGHADQASAHHIRIFALLGDPLTPARIVPAQQIYAPAVSR